MSFIGTAGVTFEAQRGSTYLISCQGITEATGVSILQHKEAGTLKASGKTASVKSSALKKKKKTLKRSAVISISSAAGQVTYVKTSGNKKISINKNTGKVTIKKGLKKGKYKVKVIVQDAGNENYEASAVNVTFTVRVKK